MKRTRALSVADGKGVQSWCERLRGSREGREERGKRAAWVSGAEKSRQCRQVDLEVMASGGGVVDVVGAMVEVGLGLLASSAERSGREAVGTGGGESVTGACASGRFEGRDGAASVDELRPNDSADRRGTSAFTGFTSCAEGCLAGN